LHFTPQAYLTLSLQLTSSTDLSPLSLHDALPILADYPLVAPSRPHNIRMHIEQTALEARRPLDIRYEQNTGLGLRCLINNGIASAIIPWDVMSVELQRGELDALKVIQPSIDRIHSLVRLEDRPVTTACRAVEGLIIELISTLCEQHLLDGEALVSPE